MVKLRNDQLLESGFVKIFMYIVKIFLQSMMRIHIKFMKQDVLFN